MSSAANRVKQLYRAGEVALGAYVTFQTPMVVDTLAVAGLDFARIDAYHIRFNPESLANMIDVCYAHGITPWVRCRNDAWVIMTTLDMGAQALTIPNVGSAAAARAAVDAVFYPPKGRREASRPLRFRGLSTADYLSWVHNEVLLSVQIEGSDGLENYKEIIHTNGVDCIQSGRDDISLALGMWGEEFHPRVLDAEKRIVSTALDAGKQVSLVHPLTPDGVERMLRWIEQGVRIHCLDSEYRVLLREYSKGVEQLRDARNRAS